MQRAGYGFKTAMWMLRKAGDPAGAVVHSIRRIGIEISTVACPRGFHPLVPRWIQVFVVHAKQERIWGLERERKLLHLLDGAGSRTTRSAGT